MAYLSPLQGWGSKLSLQTFHCLPDSHFQAIGFSCHIRSWNEKEVAMTDISKFLHKVEREKTYRGVYTTAQSLRRLGLSLKAALLLLARAHEDER